jgi:hypothetical protein
MLVGSFYARRYDNGFDYIDCLRMLDESCKRLGLRHVVITDHDLPSDLDALHTALPDNLMQAMLTGYARLREWAVGRVFLTGADCILTRNPFDYGDCCDAAYTFGPYKDCVLNTGAQWLNSLRSSELYRQALESRPGEWGEDQKALWQAVQNTDLHIRPLDAFDHNRPPISADDTIAPATVVHFRGERKSWMRPWWAKYTRENPDYLMRAA